MKRSGREGVAIDGMVEEVRRGKGGEGWREGVWGCGVRVKEVS